jgi:mono/diheme cytochrome c family protein
VTNIEIQRGPEPPSHTNTSWMALHGQVLDSSCAGCHPPKDSSIDLASLTEKPSMDGSFCGNSACHGTKWAFTAFESPAFEKIIASQKIALALAPAPAITGESGAQALTFDAAIKPMLDGKCFACHGSGASGGLDISSYATVLKGGKSGAGIVPNNLEESVLYQIQSAGSHFGQLTEEEIAILKQWIEAGAPEK